MNKLRCPKCPNLRKQDIYTQVQDTYIYSHRCAVSNLIISEFKGWRTDSLNGIKTPEGCPNKIKGIK